MGLRTPVATVSHATRHNDALELFDQTAYRLVRDLHAPSPRIFWTDLLLSATCGWLLFIGAVRAESLGATVALAAASAAFIYRAACFMHEISHIRRALLPGFEFMWNLVVGVPVLMPSFVYAGVHQDHHSLATYGTDGDPEYMPFARSRLMIVAFVTQSLLIPVFLLIRFLPLSAIGLLVPPLHRVLVRHASSLTMNIRYRREMKPAALRSVCLWEVYLLAFWGMALAGMAAGWLPWKTLLVWYAVTAAAALVNTLRTLGAHDYETDGAPRPRLDQLRDSIDTPGHVWTTLWAPVGLRYHALHHYFPGIPYHNLGKAYRRLTAADDPDHAPYLEMTSESLRASLTALYQGARRR